MTQKAITATELAQKIDHTLLKPTLTRAELNQWCDEANQFQFKTVCVPPTWVLDCVKILSNTSVGVITVVGFPLGYSTTESKVFEAKQAIAEGASEVDMVVNISHVKNHLYTEVAADIEAVAIACGKTPLKVIIETAYLTDDEKVKTAKIAEAAGAAFVKTSTGFATGVPNSGATLADIELLRKNLKSETKIKASGGIRDFETAIAMVQAGADRLGTSAGVAILNKKNFEGSY